mmetsp:Transcript_4500/g.17011  ORF Transcript_4500/g.17011 Transcript_4500/m.17011 type:complete len:98 (-) Transcript_4500:3858-4151(-)
MWSGWPLRGVERGMSPRTLFIIETSLTGEGPTILKACNNNLSQATNPYRATTTPDINLLYEEETDSLNPSAIIANNPLHHLLLQQQASVFTRFAQEK